MRVVKYLIGDIKHVQRMNRWEADQIGNFEVFINDYDDLTTIATEVYKNTPSTLNTTTYLESNIFLKMMRTLIALKRPHPG